ncbi:MAG: hypothetical protein ACLGGX_12685 [Bdellovibrionia bacterium]
MKKYVSILVAISVIPQFSIAQSTSDDFLSEVDSAVEAAQVNQVSAPSAPALPTQNVSGQPIYILNQATPAATVQQQAIEQQASVQKQPTTLIEASPITESRAEAIRRARQDAELETEQKIVEKLEAARMEDERRRAQALFGDRFNSTQETQQPAQPAVQAAPVVVAPAAAPVVVAAPLTVEEVDKEFATRDMVREELRAALDEEKTAEIEPTTSRYFSATLGIGDYPDVKNVKGNYAFGAAFGTKYDDAMIVEGSFTLANYSVDTLDYYGNYPLYTVDVNQYSAGLAAKYQFFSGMVRPVVGGLVQYSYRTFAWSDTYNYYGDETANSHAIDLGVLAGADLEFSPKFSLGFDFRYMFNMSSRTSGSNYWYGYNSNPIEKLQYYVMGLSAKVNF